MRIGHRPHQRGARDLVVGVAREYLSRSQADGLFWVGTQRVCEHTYVSAAPHPDQGVDGGAPLVAVLAGADELLVLLSQSTRVEAGVRRHVASIAQLELAEKGGTNAGLFAVEELLNRR